MSKRSLDESRESQAPEGDHNGPLPIHDLLSPGDEHDPTPPSGPTKKPRNFIATVVCILSSSEVGGTIMLNLGIGLRDLSLEEDEMRRVPAEVWTVQVPRSGVRVQ